MKLFVFGLGYAARFFVKAHRGRFEDVAATIRRPPDTQGDSMRLHGFADGALGESAGRDIADATHILVSIPPDGEGDPVLAACRRSIKAGRNLQWIGYLSSVAVYGDHAGAWIDETAPLKASSARGVRRIAAEQQWLDLGAHVFRLAGIYGPGRNALVNLRAGRAKRIAKPGQVFNRIHVEDIADVLAASMARPSGRAVFNVADDEPAPPQDVVAYAAALLRVPPPPEIPFHAADLTPMAASFYADNKRVSNRLMKEELAVILRYPTYREGLRALLAGGE